MFLVAIFVFGNVMVKVGTLVRMMSASILLLESIWVLNVVIRFTVAVMRVLIMVVLVVCMGLIMAVQIVGCVMCSVPCLLLVIVVFACRVVDSGLVTMLLSNELLVRQARILI